MNRVLEPNTEISRVATTRRPPLKKRKVPIELLPCDSSTTTPTKKPRVESRITWNDVPKVHEDHSLSHSSNGMPDIQARDVWYTREEYEDFLMDRLRTVQFLRGTGGDLSALQNSQYYCVRGLEPFQTVDAHEEMNKTRSYHQNIIIMEQARQKGLGVRDSDRYKSLVQDQSTIAAKRAQQLAALDEHEVHGRVSCRRQSLMTPMKRLPMVERNVEIRQQQVPQHLGSMSVSEKIRILQENNARKLMNIYGGSNSAEHKNMFRFPIRRDSLVGTTSLLGKLPGSSRMPFLGNMMSQTHFPILRDGLGASTLR